MLAVRIIPVLLSRGFNLVKGKQFQSWRSVGHVRQAVKIHQSRGVDELILLDISASPEERSPDFNFISDITEECFMPITVGGGVKNTNDVRRLLSAGADKVTIGTSISKDISILTECAETFGSQAIVASVDYSSVKVNGFEDKRNCVHVLCGRDPILIVNDDQDTPMHPMDWAIYCQEHGAGEILLTSIDREGMMEGYDLEMIKMVSEAVTIPVIANGGGGTYEHMFEAIKSGASAVAASSMFLFTEQTPRGAAEYMSKRGVETRL